MNKTKIGLALGALLMAAIALAPAAAAAPVGTGAVAHAQTKICSTADDASKRTEQCTVKTYGGGVCLWYSYEYNKQTKETKTSCAYYIQP